MSFFPPLPEVGCLVFLEIRNPWGKVMKRNDLRFEEKNTNKGFKIVALGKFSSLPASLVKFCPNEQDFLYKCFNAYRSRDSLSPVCRIFF